MVTVMGIRKIPYITQSLLQNKTVGYLSGHIKRYIMYAPENYVILRVTGGSGIIQGINKVGRNRRRFNTGVPDFKALFSSLLAGEQGIQAGSETNLKYIQHDAKTPESLFQSFGNEYMTRFCQSSMPGMIRFLKGRNKKR
jgi:hypothetical protein